MSKYEMIMNHITVTDEIKERVVENMEQALEGKNRKTGDQRFVKYGAVAASVAVLALGAFAAGHFMGNREMQKEPIVGEGTYSQEQNQENGDQVIWDVVEIGSADELSKKVGFEVADIASLKEQSLETHYMAFADGMAQIIYTVGEKDIYYRKSSGSEDNSGDYNEYAVVETVDVEGIVVTLKGNDGGYSLALWESDGYSYSLGGLDGVSKEELVELVSESMGVQ